MRRYWTALALLVVLLGVWELFSRANSTLLFVCPPPSAILATLWRRGSLFLEHTMATGTVMILGFCLALIAAFPLAWAMMRSPVISGILQPAFVVIQCVPMFTLAPIMVLWFGWTLTAVVVPTALMVFFPLTLSVYRGLSATPQPLLDYFSVNKATALQQLWKLRLPWALPQIFSGFRISAAVAGSGAVAGEWAGAQKGLGVLMLESRRAADLETCFAALFCLTAISLTLYGIASAFEASARHPHRFRFRYARAAAIAVAVALLPGCSSDSANGSDRRILVLDWLPNPNHVPLFVAIEKGYFSEAGIDLHIHRVNDPGDGLPLVTSQQVDFAVNYMPAVLVAASHGAALNVAGVVVDQPLNRILYRKDAGINVPGDLSGKTIGWSASAEGSVVLEALLQEVEASSGHLLQVGFDLVPTLATGQVDAVYGAYYNIEIPQLEGLGVAVGSISLVEMGMPPYHELIVVTREALARSATQEMAAFREGLQKAIDWCRKNPAEAFEIYAALNPSKDEKTLAWERRAWALTVPVLACDQEVRQELWEDYAAWQRELHLVEREYPEGLLFRGS